MYKYSPNNSSRSELRSKVPRFKHLNHLYAGTPSPKNSNNSSFTQASFSFAPSRGPVKVPRLNTRAVLSSKNISIERNTEDLECFDCYK